MGIKKYKYVSVDVLIGAETVLTGELISKSAVKIDGAVHGNITTTQEVIVSESGTVEGNITAAGLIVSGKIIGDAKITEQLLIKETGHLEGNIEAGSLVIEAGGEFYGMNRSVKHTAESSSTEAETE
ncbi:MAG: polymer-forming cytoskeletal protein [Clostridia bacterium]|nr:polymer-forming cytoskeletal protein [Clostridia bacterium]